jgi:hypothetical protein
MKAKNIKKEVVNNWSDQFLDLSVFGQNKLYKVCGAFLFGIELISLPRTDEYRPVFVFYPLWKKDVKHCLVEPIFMREIYNKKGFQFNIPYKTHLNFFHEATECTKNQVSILGHQDISIKQLFEVFDKQFSQTLIRSSPVGQAKLFEAKLLCALYVNNLNTVEQIFNEIDKASMSWSPNLFDWKFGSVDTWLQSLLATVNCRDGFLIQIKANKQNKSISPLNRSEITA